MVASERMLYSFSKSGLIDKFVVLRTQFVFKFVMNLDLTRHPCGQDLQSQFSPTVRVKEQLNVTKYNDLYSISNEWQRFGAIASAIIVKLKTICRLVTVGLLNVNC